MPFLRKQTLVTTFTFRNRTYYKSPEPLRNPPPLTILFFHPPAAPHQKHISPLAIRCCCRAPQPMPSKRSRARNLSLSEPFPARKREPLYSFKNSLANSFPLPASLISSSVQSRALAKRDYYTQEREIFPAPPSLFITTASRITRSGRRYRLSFLRAFSSRSLLYYDILRERGEAFAPWNYVGVNRESRVRVRSRYKSLRRRQGVNYTGLIMLEFPFF